MGISWRAAELDALSTLGVLAVGAWYDLQCCLIAAMALMPWILLPDRLWHTRGNRLAWRLVGFGLLVLFAIVAVAEVVFWQEFEVRFNFIAVDYLVYTHEVLRNLWESYRVTWGLLAVLGLALCAWRWLSPRLDAALAATERPWAARSAVILFACLLITGFAQQTDDWPRDLFDNVYRQELASNGPMQFVAAFRRNELDFDRFYATRPTQEVNALIRREIQEHALQRFVSSDGVRRYIDNPRPTRRLNVVLVMMESMSADFIGHYSDAHRWAPRLDALMADSLTFENFYATGTRTDRGLEAVTLSVPPTPGRSIVKRLGHETGYWSLGQVLRANGYDVSFVYGGRAYFDNMATFFGGNGYRVVDQSTVPDSDISFENAWGMSDEDLYRQALQQADATHARGKPFFMHLMTTSNHRPYTFPEGRIPLPSGSGRPGAVRYADWALGQFIEDARQHAWFEDTVFVVLGDHCASSAGKVDLPAARYHIPLLIYSPRHVAPGRVDTVSSQIDVAPTLLALLGIDYESVAYGRDILTLPAEAGRALLGNYQYLGLLADGAVTVLGPGKSGRRHPAAAAAASSPVDGKDPTLRRTVAYYQSASDAFHHRLLAWRAPVSSTSAGPSR